MSMNARPHSPPGAYYRLAVNHNLAVPFTDLAAARSADRQARCARRRATTSAADSMRLVTALRACAAALELHQLPVARTIRDELRLRRQLTT
jgi:hypothetical protein